MPALIAVHGKITFGQIAGYLGLIPLGSTGLSIGIFGSALTKSQLVAIISSAAILVGLILSWLMALITDRRSTSFSPGCRSQQALPAVHDRAYQHAGRRVLRLAVVLLPVPGDACAGIASLERLGPVRTWLSRLPNECKHRIDEEPAGTHRSWAELAKSPARRVADAAVLAGLFLIFFSERV